MADRYAPFMMRESTAPRVPGTRKWKINALHPDWPYQQRYLFLVASRLAKTVARHPGRPPNQNPWTAETHPTEHPHDHVAVTCHGPLQRHSKIPTWIEISACEILDLARTRFLQNHTLVIHLVLSIVPFPITPRFWTLHDRSRHALNNFVLLPAM